MPLASSPRWRFRSSLSGDEDDRDAGVDLANALEDIEAEHVGQVQVEDHDVGSAPGDDLQPLGPVEEAVRSVSVGSSKARRNAWRMESSSSITRMVAMFALEAVAVSKEFGDR